MPKEDFWSRLDKAILGKKTRLCAYLSPAPEAFPNSVKEQTSERFRYVPILDWLMSVVDASAEYVLCYVLDFDTFSLLENGNKILSELIEYIKEKHNAQAILDVTARIYGGTIMQEFCPDAVIYTRTSFNEASLLVFARDFGKGLIGACLFDNPAVKMVQEMNIRNHPIWSEIAREHSVLFNSLRGNGLGAKKFGLSASIIAEDYGKVSFEILENLGESYPGGWLLATANNLNADQLEFLIEDGALLKKDFESTSIILSFPLLVGNDVDHILFTEDLVKRLRYQINFNAQVS